MQTGRGGRKRFCSVGKKGELFCMKEEVGMKPRQLKACWVKTRGGAEQQRVYCSFRLKEEGEKG